MNTQNQLTDILDEFPELKPYTKELEILIDWLSKESQKSYIDPKFKSSLRAKILEKASQKSNLKKSLLQKISLSPLFRYGFAPAFTFFCIVGIFALWNQEIKQTLPPVYDDSSIQISPVYPPKLHNTKTPKVENTSPKDMHENSNINTTLLNNTKEHSTKKVSPSEIQNTKDKHPNFSEVPLQKSSQWKSKQQDIVQENIPSQPLYSSQPSSSLATSIEGDIEYIESQAYTTQDNSRSISSSSLKDIPSKFEVFCQNSGGYTKTGATLSLCIRESTVCSEIDFDIQKSQCLWKGKLK